MELLVRLGDVLKGLFRPTKQTISADNGSFAAQEVSNSTVSVTSLNLNVQDSKDAETLSRQIEGIALASKRHLPQGLIDEKVIEQSRKIRQIRFLASAETKYAAIKLGQSVTSGEYSAASDTVRAQALAWCARILANTDCRNIGAEFVEASKRLDITIDGQVADAILSAFNGDYDLGMQKLDTTSDPTANTARFILRKNEYGEANVYEWFKSSRYTVSDLDADGKFFLLSTLQELGHWTEAIDVVETLGDADFTETPILLFAAASSLLANSVPEDLREVIRLQVPLSAKDFALADDANSVAQRKTAINFFRRFADFATQVGHPAEALIAEDFELWLCLKDNELANDALRKLKENLSNEELCVRRVPLALSFGVNLDMDLTEKAIERSAQLGDRHQAEAACARFAIAMSKDTPEGVIGYIYEHYELLKSCIRQEALDSIEIEALAKSETPRKAEHRLAEMEAEGRSAEQLEKLERLINRGSGKTATDQALEEFKSANTTTNLIILVRCLESENNDTELLEYAQLLFARTKSIEDAERITRILEQLGLDEAQWQFLADNHDLVENSTTLKLAWAWAKYRSGHFIETGKLIEELKVQTDSPGLRGLHLNWIVSSGNWDQFGKFISEQLEKIDHRSPHELLSYAKIALFIDQKKEAKDFLLRATKIAPDDPNILLSAYGIATLGGFEDQKEVFSWLETAAALSDENGPVQKKSLKDLASMAPNWHRHEDHIWEMIHSGSAPMFMAAEHLNQSLTSRFWLPSLANSKETELKKFSANLPAYSGQRSSGHGDVPAVIGVDSTAWLTITLLNLFDLISDNFSNVAIPHSTLAWLFSEIEKTKFHQPSQFKKARNLRDLVATKRLHEFEGPATPALSEKTGDRVASMLEAAQSEAATGCEQHLVVHSYPITLAGSLLQEPADVDDFKSHLISCLAVVDKLEQEGLLTTAELQKAKSYLALHDHRWPEEPSIGKNAAIYLDNTAISYFQHIGLLDKISAICKVALIPADKVRDTDIVLQHEDLIADMTTKMFKIQEYLRDGIQSTFVSVNAVTRDEENEEEGLFINPTLDILNIADEADAVLVDDRFVNQHENIQKDSILKPILSTQDLLTRLVLKGKISQEILVEYLTALRRFGYLLVRLGPNELEHLISSATIVEGRVQESAELKNIREYLLRIRKSSFLKLPEEGHWIDDIIKTTLEALLSLWKNDASLDTQARSNWLLRLLDLHEWAQANCNNLPPEELAFKKAGIPFLLFRNSFSLPKSNQKAFVTWLDENAFQPMQQNDPRSYKVLVELAKDWIDENVEGILSAEERSS